MTLLEGLTAITAVILAYYAWQTKKMAEATKSLAEEEKENRIHQRNKISILKSLMHPSLSRKTYKEIAQKTGLPPEVILDLVTELAAEGAIQRDSNDKQAEEGWFYSIIRRN